MDPMFHYSSPTARLNFAAAPLEAENRELAAAPQAENPELAAAHAVVAIVRLAVVATALDCAATFAALAAEHHFLDETSTIPSALWAWMV